MTATMRLLGASQAWPFVAVLVVAAVSLVAGLAARRSSRVSGGASAGFPSERTAPPPSASTEVEEVALNDTAQPVPDDPFARMEAIEALAGAPSEVDALLDALHDDYPVVRRQAVRSLRSLSGPEVTRALLDAASQDPSAEVREEAVAALGAMLQEYPAEQHA